MTARRPVALVTVLAVAAVLGGEVVLADVLVAAATALRRLLPGHAGQVM